MTRRRWIADEVSGDRASLIGDHAQHLTRVLRARVGDRFDIATGAVVRSGQVISLADGRVDFELGEEIVVAGLSEIIVVLSVFKFDRMEWAIEKCTELGVARIVPLIAHRTDSHLSAASTKRIERWRRIARQASEQSRRVVPPEIAAPIKVEEALMVPGTLRIVLSEVEERTLLRDVVRSDVDNSVVVAVGPEGGWTEDELRSFQRAGWISASLGNTILRAETAAIAASAIVASALSSF
jgi:16S rRNA (uracil1498-N3)-methyltransferase